MLSVGFPFSEFKMPFLPSMRIHTSRTLRALDRSSLPAILLKSKYPMRTLRTRPLSLF